MSLCGEEDMSDDDDSTIYELSSVSSDGTESTSWMSHMSDLTSPRSVVVPKEKAACHSMIPIATPSLSRTSVRKLPHNDGNTADMVVSPKDTPNMLKAKESDATRRQSSASAANVSTVSSSATTHSTDDRTMFSQRTGSINSDGPTSAGTLAKYIQRFRHAPALSRESRHRLRAAQMKDFSTEFWWLTPPSSTTDTNLQVSETCDNIFL